MKLHKGKGEKISKKVSFRSDVGNAVSNPAAYPSAFPFVQTQNRIFISMYLFLCIFYDSGEKNIEGL